MKPQPKRQRHRTRRPAARKTTPNPKHATKKPNAPSPITELNLPIVSSFQPFHSFYTFSFLYSVFFLCVCVVTHSSHSCHSIRIFKCFFGFFIFRFNCYFSAKESMGAISTDCQFLFPSYDSCCNNHRYVYLKFCQNSR